MADIFEEVEEGLRQDRFSGLWKKYGIFAYLGAALLIGGVALNEYLKIQAVETIEENAGRLEAALNEVDARNYEAAAEQLSGIAGDDIPPSDVAAHFLAGVRLDGNGDALAAADVLSNAAGDAAGPAQKLALIKAAYLRADTMSRIELEAMLAPISEGTGPFAALSTELIAAKALQEGDIEFARREFGFLRLAQNVPPGVVTRAEQALAALPREAESPVEPETEAETDAEAETDLVPTDTTETPAEPGTEESTEETPE